MIPLMSHVPASAPTKSKISKAPVTDFKFSATFWIINSYSILFLKPIIAATAPPIKRINWLDPLSASSP